MTKNLTKWVHRIRDELKKDTRLSDTYRKIVMKVVERTVKKKK